MIKRVVNVLIIAVIIFGPFSLVRADVGYVASGFADTSYNGTYCVGGAGLVNGYPYFANQNGLTFVFVYSANNTEILATKSLGDETGPAIDYYSFDSNQSPLANLLSWTAFSGPAPAGSFTLSSCGLPPPPAGVAGLISNASTTMFNDLGIGLGDVSGLMKSAMSLVAGTGLGILPILLPFIIALVIISIIVYFLFRGFRFFRH